MSFLTSPSRQPWFSSRPAEVVTPKTRDQEQWRSPTNGAQQAPQLVHLENDPAKKPRWMSLLGRRISWLTIIAFISSLAGTLVVWAIVRANERTHMHRVTRLATAAIHADVESDMQTWVLGQVRLAKLWEFGATSKDWSAFANSYDQWSAFANLYIEHHPGCLAIEWLDPKYAERWLVRPHGATPVPLAGADVHERVLKRAEESGQTVLSPVLVSAQGRNQWLVVVPIYQKTQFRGFVLGFFDAQESLDSTFEDVQGLGFSAALEDNGREFYRLPGSTTAHEREWAESMNVTLPGTTWRLRVWPKAEGMAELRSQLPWTTLLCGGLLTLLLTLTVQTNAELRRGIAERRRAEEALAASQARFAGILELSAEAVISMDERSRITLFNQGAEATFGYTAQEVLGQSLDLLIPRRFREAHAKHVADFARSGKHNLLLAERRTVAGLRKDGTEFPMAASVSQLKMAGEKIFTIICSDVTNQVRAQEELRHAHDELELRVRARTAELETANLTLQSEITERKLAEEEVTKLSAQMMRVQDEERRHLARELHDGTTQNLVAIALNLTSARDATLQDPVAHERVEESLRLAEQCANELRTISYLLHPPLLEELGLDRALRGYVDGFSRRSGIEVKLNAKPDLGKLGFEVELTVFRIVQEALANVHRHSQSRTACITFVRDGDGVVLEIADQGRGMPESTLSSGVGIAGMRERVRLLKGRMDVASNASGTTIRVYLPLG